MATRLLALPFALPLTLLLAACGPDRATDAMPADPPQAVRNAAPPAGVPPTGAVAPQQEQAGPGVRTDAGRAVDASIERVLGDPRPYRAVIERLQAAVAADDAAAVAALVDYPIQVRIDGAPTTLGDEAAFVARYGEFMTPGIRAAIVDTRYGDLFVNQDGVMFGSGQAWINGVCQDSACNGVEVRVVALQPGVD